MKQHFKRPIFFGIVSMSLIWPCLLFAENVAELEKRANLPEIDEQKLSNVPVRCLDRSKALLGNLPCGDFGGSPGFMNTVSRNVQQIYGNMQQALKRGFKLNWRGESTYLGANACNLLEGEGESASDDALNSAGKLCGKFCDIRVSVGVTGVDISVSDHGGMACRREYGFYQGLFAQVLKKYQNEVLAEFRAKDLKLVDFDGVKPCAPVARDALRLQMGANDAIEGWVKKYGAEKVEAMRCERLKMDGENPSQAASNGIGECSMSYAQASVPGRWTYLLGCEIEMRAKKFMVVHGLEKDRWFNDGRESVGKKCEAEVCTFCSDSKRSKQAMDCYKREMPKFIRQKMIELQLGAARSPMPFEAGLFIGFLFPFGIRSRKKANRGHSKKYSLAVMLMIALAMIASGCGCKNEPNLDCSQCVAPTATLDGFTKGCAYKLCMESRWNCGSDPGDGGKRVALAIATGLWSLLSKDSNAERIFCQPRVYYNDKVAKAKGLKPTPPKNDSSEVDPSDPSYVSLQKEIVKQYEIEADAGGVSVYLKSAKMYCSRAVGGMDMTDWHHDYDPAEDHAGDKVTASKIDPDFQNVLKARLALDQDGTANGSCHQGPGGPGSPQEQSGAGFGSAAGALGGALEQSGSTGNGVTGDKKKSLLAGGQKAENLETASDKPNAKLSKNVGGSGPAGPGAGGNSGGSKMVPFGSMTGGAGGGGNAGGLIGGSDSKDQVAADEASGKIQAGADGYVSSAQSGSSGPSKPNSGGLFGGGDSAGAAGLNRVSYNNALDAAAADLDAYLAKVGTMSLFEIVNKRMDKWGNELNTERAQGEFRKLSN